MIEFNNSLVKEYLPQVYGFVRRYFGNPDVAADVTQEVFVKAWKNFNKFDQAKSFRSWIFTIAKNTAIDEMKKKRALPLDETLEIPDSAPSFFSQLMQKQTASELSFAMSQLPSHYSSVINLHIHQDLTFREIAGALKQPLNTVKSQYRRGLALLKKLI